MGVEGGQSGPRESAEVENHLRNLGEFLQRQEKLKADEPKEKNIEKYLSLAARLDTAVQIAGQDYGKLNPLFRQLRTANQTDRITSNALLSSQFLVRNNNVPGKLVYTFNTQGNAAVNRCVGAGDCLPDEAYQVRINNGEIATRDVRLDKNEIPRIGYYYADGSYAAIFDGDQVTVEKTLKSNDPILKQLKQKQENSLKGIPPVPVAKKAPVERFVHGTQVAGYTDLRGTRSREYQPKKESEPIATAAEDLTPEQQEDSSDLDQYENDIHGYTSINGKVYQEIRRNFWTSRLGGTQEEGQKSVTKEDPVTGEGLTFLGCPIPDGMSEKIIPYLKEAERRILAKGIKYKIHTATCTCWREVRGSKEGNLSLHSWGVALDINPASNGQGIPWKDLDKNKRVPPGIIQIMESCGFYWGGRFPNPDSMHFEFRLNPYTSTDILKDPESQKYGKAVFGEDYKNKESGLRKALQKKGREKGLVKETRDKTDESARNENSPESSERAAKAAPGKTSNIPEYRTKFNRDEVIIYNKIERYQPFIEQAIAEAENKTGMKIPVEFIYTLIRRESDGRTDVASSKDAGGLMQVVRNTAGSYGFSQDEMFPSENGKLNPRDARNNPQRIIRAGVLYFADRFKQFNGDLLLAAASYNAGSGNVTKYGNKIPPFSETEKYVRNLREDYYKMTGILLEPPSSVRSIQWNV